MMNEKKPRRAARIHAHSTHQSDAAGDVASTPHRILDAAEQLFADRGPHGVSLREVIDLAGVNIAAINYHFGSKEQLFDEVVVRSIDRIADCIGDALKEAQRANSAALSLEEVIRAYFRGGLRSELRVYLRLRTWMGLVNAERAAELLSRHFDAVTREYLEALHLALPRLSQTELGWRLYVMTATLLFNAYDVGRLETFTEGKADSGDVLAVVSHLVPLLADGFHDRGPAVAKKRSSGRSKARRTEH